MKPEWEAWTKPDGTVGVQLSDGEVITIKNDGITGYGFVMDYLNRVGVHYKNHLRAADLILRRVVGDESYNRIRKVPNVYNSNLAIVSMNCGFGNMDNVPDYDSFGEFHFEFTACPFRATCPYNGYNTSLSGKELVCCNPIYETGLTSRQREVADFLINTSYTNSDIGLALGISEKCVKYHISEIYTTLDVNSRQELSLLLKGKRIV